MIVYYKVERAESANCLAAADTFELSFLEF